MDPTGFISVGSTAGPPWGARRPLPPPRRPHHERLSLRRPLRHQPHVARARHGARRGPRAAAHDGHRGGRLLGDRQVLGDDVLRRPRPLPLHERGLRALRPRQRPPARHVPERHQVRGGDHLHDAGTAVGAPPRPRPATIRAGSSPPAAPGASCTPSWPTASTRRRPAA